MQERSSYNINTYFLSIKETLRKYPPHPFLDRECDQDYRVPNTDIIIKKGTSVCIPVLGLHYDRKYFVDPEKFNPGRFCCENRQGVPEFAYIPFAKGARCCIGKFLISKIRNNINGNPFQGERFGFIATKLGLARILLEYEVIRNAKTPACIKPETRSFLLASKLDLPMTFKKSY